MNLKEKQMLNLLKDLKENHNVIGIKAEFEAEGTRSNEMINLCQIVHKADSSLYLKIGGCEAVSDMDAAKNYGVVGIIAPMIESPFALKKFHESVIKTFSKDEIKEMDFLINIETKTAYTCLNDIMDSADAEFLFGAVIGRVDLSASYNLGRVGINSDEMFELCKNILEKLQSKKKLAGMGGAISYEALPFIKKLGSLIERTETRKVIFDLKSGTEKLESGLKKAMEFEYLYMLNFADIYSKMSLENEFRIKMLKDRLDCNLKN